VVNGQGRQENFVGAIWEARGGKIIFSGPVNTRKYLSEKRSGRGSKEKSGSYLSLMDSEEYCRQKTLHVQNIVNRTPSGERIKAWCI